MSHPEYVQELIAEAYKCFTPEALRTDIDRLVRDHERLFETVRTLAALAQESERWTLIHAQTCGFDPGPSRGAASVYRQLGELIADELTWDSDKEAIDAFGGPA